MTASPNTTGQRPVIKMNTNTRSAGNAWVQKHATPQPAQPTAPNTPQQPQVATAQPTLSTESTQSPVAEASSPALSPQYAALARQGKALRKAQQEFKAQQDAWKQEQAKYISRESLNSDPLKTLTDAGLSYDKLTELQLSQASPDPNQALLDKITALEAKLSTVDEQFSNRDKQAYDQAIATIRKDADLLVTSDPAYETIQATNSVGDVVKLIQAVFEQEGDILSVEEAAQLVEDQLVERKFDEISRLSKLAKISKKLAPVQPVQPPAVATAPEQGTAQKQSRTLTNAQSSTRPFSSVERAIEIYKQGMSKR